MLNFLFGILTFCNGIYMYIYSIEIIINTLLNLLFKIHIALNYIIIINKIFKKADCYMYV